MSVSFGDEIMNFLWFNVGVELVVSFLVLFLKKGVLFLSVESGLALSNHWFENAHTLRWKFSVFLSPLNTFVASLREERSSSVRVVQLVVVLVGECSV